MEQESHITPQQMAQYLSDALSSPKAIALMQSAENADNANYRFKIMGHFLLHYVSATEDLSAEGQQKILQILSDHIDETKTRRTDLTSGHIRVFNEEVLPQITSFWQQKLGYENQKLNFDMTEQICAKVKQTTTNNQFWTHSFNGAMLPDIEANGLDISKEKFQENYKTLEKVTKTPFKVGKLYACELSDTSFGYCTGTPERFWLTIGGRPKLEAGESLLDGAKRQLRKTIAEKGANLSESEKQELLKAGDELCEFYTSSDKVGMAIFYPNGESKDEVKHFSQEPFSFIKTQGADLLNFPYSVTKNLSAEQKEQISAIKKQLFSKDCNLEQARAQIWGIYKNIAAEHPEQTEALYNVADRAYIKAMDNYCLQKFDNSAYGDGYVLDGGKLSKDKFALASFPQPASVYLRYQEQNAQSSK